MDLARNTIVPMWGLQDRSEDVITPKSLTVSVGYSAMPLDVKYEKSSLICGSSYSVKRGIALWVMKTINENNKFYY